MTAVKAILFSEFAQTAVSLRARGLITVIEPPPKKMGGPRKHYTDAQRRELKGLRSKLWRDKKNGRDGLRYQRRIDAIVRPEAADLIPPPPIERYPGHPKQYTRGERRELKGLRTRRWRDKKTGRDGLRYQLSIDYIFRRESLRANTNGTTQPLPP